MIGSVPQSNMVPSGEMESFHNMANSPKDGGPEGYNYRNDCSNCVVLNLEKIHNVIR